MLGPTWSSMPSYIKTNTWSCGTLKPDVPIFDPFNYPQLNMTFVHPVLPLKIHGLFSQNSSLMRSTCSVKIFALLLFFLSLSFCVRLIWTGLPPLPSRPAEYDCFVGARFFFVDSDLEVSLAFRVSDSSTFDFGCASRFDREASLDDTMGWPSISTADLGPGTELWSLSYSCA